MSLFQRILREHRPAIILIVAALVLNVAAYVLVVRPLGVRSATSADRAQVAAANLRAADADRNAARALVSGKQQAEQELSTFYDKVLPADQSAARQLTYAPLPALAQKTNVKWSERRSVVEAVKNTDLARLRISMVLEGDYANIRRFIYELETSPAFVIIDDVTLAQDEMDKPLILTLELSTYFKASAHGN
jgi:Tfp pilus assembly protein PilO